MLNIDGEKEFLAKYLSEILGINIFSERDDCIFAKINKTESLVYSIDRPELISFEGSREDVLRKQGRWCAAHVANDVIACGIRPRGISFDIGVLNFDKLKEISSWAHGVLETCNRYNMKYEGGNLANEKGISGVAWGIGNNKQIIKRSGAKPKSIVLATAKIGTGWAIRLLQHDKKDSNFLKKYYNYKDYPMINIDAFEEIWGLNAILCGMDLSDGLIEFGYEILEQSNLGVEFHIPINLDKDILLASQELSLPVESLMFEPGYDTPFAHGWCIDRKMISKVISILDKFKVPYTILGEVREKNDGVYFKKEGGLINLPRYWDDVLMHRGSIDHWRNNILSIFNKD